MKKNIFVEELNRRKKEDDNAYMLIGTELKRVRTNQSQTLSSIAGDLCSVSYLCKVENAQIKPNRYMLNEICKKLDMATPKLDILFELKNILFKMVKLYYNNKTKEIEDIFTTCKELDNYRTKLISFIYFITKYQFVEANAVAKELFKITNLMHNDELNIFIVFYSILLYYEENYEEVIDNLRELTHKLSLEEELGKLAAMICLECYVKLNSPMTILHSQKLLDLLLKSSEFSKAEYVRYLQLLYMLLNNMIEQVEKDLVLFKNPEYKNTLEFYCDIKRGVLKKQRPYKALRPFGKLLYFAIYNRENYFNTFCSMDKTLGLTCDFSYNIANYIILSDDTERFKELTDIIIPNIKQTKCEADRIFFLKEYCRICSKFGRYKNFCKAYEELEGGKLK